MLWMVLIMIAGLMLVSRFANRQQQKMLEEQKRRTAEALVVGNWVKTRAGFYGTVVEIDGDVVTLATPLGDESLWETSAILGAEEPPFAVTDSQDDQVPDSTEPDTAAPDAADAADAAATAAGQAATDAAEAATTEQENHDR